jgi:hypothetical protein
MTSHRPVLRKIAVSLFLVTSSFHAADALEANAVGDRLKVLMGMQGVDIAWANISQNGAQIVLEGATIKLSGTKEDPVALGNVTLDSVSEENGGYRVGTVTLPTYALAQKDLKVDISGAVLTGLTLPAEKANDPLADILMYETADLANVSVRMNDKPLFTMGDLHVEISAPEDGKPLEFTGKAGNFSADLTAVEDPKAMKLIDGLGYRTLNGTAQMAGSWQPTDGRMTLSQYDISIENAGTLGMTFDLAGYTPDFIKALQDLQKKIAEQPKGSDDSAQGLAMLGLMQQLTFHGATIRFDDDSLTGKMLAYIAQQQSQKPMDIANQAKAILPFMMAQLNNPEFTKNVTEAVGKYLDDPKSIEIRAAPASPVPFALVMAGAVAAPKELPKTLGVTVVANE